MRDRLPILDWTRLTWHLLLGVLLSIAAIWLGSLETKRYVAIVFLIAGGIPLLYALLLASSDVKQRSIILLIFVLVMGVPFNLDVNFFLIEYTGTASIDIGLSLIAATGIAVVLGYWEKASYFEEFVWKVDKKLLFFAVLYMVCGVMSIVNADHLNLVLYEEVRWLVLIFIGVIVMNLREDIYLRTIVFTFSMAIFFQAAIAFYQYKTGSLLGLGILGEEQLIAQDIGEVMERATGTIGDPNILGYFFEMLIPVMFAMKLAERRFHVRLWYFAAFIAGLVGIYTTLSRGAWATLPISLGIVYWIMFRDRLFQLKTIIWTWFAGIVMVLVLAASFQTVYNRFTHDDYGSAATRAPLNESAFSIVKQFPVFGFGLNNMAASFKKYDLEGHSRMFRGKNHIVHNMYLQVWTEVGTAGLLAFLGLQLTAIFTSLRLALYRAERWHKGLMAGVSAGIIAQSIHASVDIGFKLTMNTSILFFIFVGVIGGVNIIYARRDRAVPQEKNG